LSAPAVEIAHVSGKAGDITKTATVGIAPFASTQFDYVLTFRHEIDQMPGKLTVVFAIGMSASFFLLSVPPQTSATEILCFQATGIDSYFSLGGSAYAANNPCKQPPQQAQVAATTDAVTSLVSARTSLVTEAIPRS
jgi:hypothetical protein